MLQFDNVTLRRGPRVSRTGRVEGLRCRGPARVHRAAGPARPLRRARRRVDPQRQIALAEQAFRGNGFVVLVGDRQIEELDDEVDLRRNTEVTFLKLVPLVGG